MKVMNALYQGSGDWLIYSNYLGEKAQRKTVVGLSREIEAEVLASNSYRAGEEWVTSALRTYLRDLYVKVPRSYFLETETKFYASSSDRFQMYALVELAGPKHTKNVHDLFYRYTYTLYSECSEIEAMHYKLVCKGQTPLLPLDSLEDEAKMTGSMWFFRR